MSCSHLCAGRAEDCETCGDKGSGPQPSFDGIAVEDLLDQTETGAVISMPKSAVPTKAIIREIRQNTGKIIQTQDIMNVRAKNDAVGREERTEEQMLNFGLSDRRKNKDAFVEVCCIVATSTPSLVHLRNVTQSGVRFK